MKIHAITIDCAEPQELAAWWAKALGVPVGNDFGSIVQLASSEAFPQIQFQKTDDKNTRPGRVHADFRVPDLDKATDHLVAIGATIKQEVELPQIRYTSFLDPVGNAFDVIEE
nr:VOC family protein [uncultured Cohaesibacter sp.]